MSQYYRCDRCREIIENGIQEFLTMPLRKTNYDLCFKCWQEFKEFMGAKGNIHLFRKIKPFRGEDFESLKDI